jgi:hypothetical protein
MPSVAHDVMTGLQREIPRKASAGANALVPASPGMRHAVGAPAGTAKTAVVPDVTNLRPQVRPRPSDLPGGTAPAAPGGPPRERGQRRRPPPTAKAGALGRVSPRAEVALGQPPSPAEVEGSIAKVSAMLDRISGWLLVLVVAAVVGMVAAAELSPSADAALRGIIHIDIRQMLANFGHQLQQLWGRLHS